MMIDRQIQVLCLFVIQTVADSTFIGSELSEDNPTINDESFDISKDEVNFMNSTYQTAFSESFSGTMNTISRFHLLVLLS